MPSKSYKISDKAALPFKTENKLKRQSLHIKQKKAKDSQRRADRFGRKKAEEKDPRLREDRLRRNVPLTLDRKRVWDEVDEDAGDGGLGVSVDVERLKRQRLEEDQALSEVAEDGEDSDGDDKDSMLDGPSSEQDTDAVDPPPTRHTLPSTKQLRSATQRATSPTRSTTSTNLALAPEALAAKFSTLFSSDPPPTPKILITTSINSPSTTKHAYSPTSFRTQPIYPALPIATAINSPSAKYPPLPQIKQPSGLTIVHLPKGPTFHFTIANWYSGTQIPGHGKATSHIPELILNNFRTPLGLLTAHLFRSLFPPSPDLSGRQVVTLHNQRDFIFLRRHRYVFRDKRETEKSVVGPDGKDVKGVEAIRAGLQELGPRFTLKLRRVDKGIQRASGQEWEWKGRTDKVRTKFQL